MTTHTAEEFKHARFATHPDGRIAARIGSRYYSRWASSVGGDTVLHSDVGMARGGWSPLDETRLPVATTGDMRAAARAAFTEYTGIPTLSGEHGGNADFIGEGVDLALTAALSAAPTADEDARTYALEQIEAAQAETTEAVTRAEKAEQELDKAKDERDKYRQQAQLLGNLYEERLGWTAREHLDAAWEAAHVPADVTIPAGAWYVESSTDGTTVHGPWEAPNDLAARIGLTERRLLDPPTPKAPEWADAPAVFAVADAYGRTLWSNEGNGTWRRGTNFVAPTSALEDVTPLYPGRVTEDGEGER